MRLIERKKIISLLITSFSTLLVGCATDLDKNISQTDQKFSKTMKDNKLEEKQINSTDESWYTLRNAVYSHDFVEASLLVKKKPSLLSSTNSIGETVLHFVAVENDLEGVEWLHANGANIDTKNEFGEPVIFEVASLGYKELFAWFAKSGANLHVIDAENRDVVAYLIAFDKHEMAEWIRTNYPDIQKN
ncbi:ankyrin repeat domain-containing protein [Collimonas humicola]|uniref:ankyrin repeat domain-containing protein n=1 Tax=Collimonas humicola TaxID=2825886 RepID=UPI001B8A9639|nr:ankyrin repeat domain-containing protein [Collimonas humicola]